mgnify:CR=1 FL=1
MNSLVLASLSLPNLVSRLPGGVAQGIIWGIMALGVYITFRLLDVADLTVDGSFTTGGAVTVMLIIAGWPAWAALLAAVVAGLLAGLVTGLLHTKLGIPAILAGILTQLALYSINLRIMDSKANQALSVDKYPLLLSQRYVRELSMNNPLPLLLLFTAAVIAILYWFFGTEKGSSLRATGANPHMARAQGINTNSNIVLGLMVSNGLVALSGALLAQYQGSSDINMGRGAIVIGLAAVIIGEVIFGKIFTNFGLTLLATLVLTKVTKVPSDFKGMLASSGLGMTFPATLAAGSIVLLLVYPGLISLLGVASFAVWAVVTVGTLLQVYGVKLNLVTILLCVAFCIAGYYVVSGLRDWFLHACYSYDINDVLSGLGDLFG